MAASVCPEFGLVDFRASRRQMRNAPFQSRPRNMAAMHMKRALMRAGMKLQISSRRAAAVPKYLYWSFL